MPRALTALRPALVMRIIQLSLLLLTVALLSALKQVRHTTHDDRRPFASHEIQNRETVIYYHEVSLCEYPLSDNCGYRCLDYHLTITSSYYRNTMPMIVAITVRVAKIYYRSIL